ncbi:UDP-3-O-acyl-N-acetylglucosamine deacetylase [Acinetobacter baumannii]|uniref:UDP-3-O-acyl-N-acetylglucosamine deacetylase n=1 Tax=Acinetobacter baumannii TaxID=470 RepID=A0A432AGE4_ACIBA|nr:UDP-3-O-acyl-N-acetylglucosamine deacetylase [Acinetobacter baumannii]EHU1922105.1 UDP-3-O-acyl-N-acetylglucosamine deacetylase [Acinetobacter baumannii]EHU1986926.1 UDP-3-O-acyl-N-acetylglucosamine deacetylase [Acinetobacter baumannii]EHU2637397.1 UDP-3-O-acyl-N-acetylglucosamine deacetylase [Acinetobacter baumannii]EHU3100648.1 UDP-3-O-acyl-N-acetylglucosamine deacetylase [Acinetobacter baumannii]EHU3110803.1 UDP-3-O-acyl-N-acetylglucosamine deacetylase [Acinetobacter baumannii]
MVKQRTLNRVVKASGIGLHSGQKVMINFIPHTVDGGIVFRRIDLDPPVDIPANALLIQEAFMCSNLVTGDIKVGTIEHVMSAIAGLGIDNLIVEVSASEVPIMDGSAGPFIYLLMQGGLREQDAPKKFIKILKPVGALIDDKKAIFSPHNGFQLNFTIDFDHPAFAKEYQSATIDFSTETFVYEVSEARTFGFMKDLDYLKANNLALGASLDNAIGVDDTGVVNEEGLRFADEFVRHKILDAVGDLYLLGHQIIAKFDGYKSGHALNNQLLRNVQSDPSNYEIVTFDDEKDCPIPYVSVT